MPNNKEKQIVCLKNGLVFSVMVDTLFYTVKLIFETLLQLSVIQKMVFLFLQILSYFGRCVGARVVIVKNKSTSLVDFIYLFAK